MSTSTSRPSSSSSTMKPENLSLSNTKFKNLLSESMRYKERSHNTHEDTHRPLLNQTSQNDDSSPTPVFNVVFIGDSMFERLKSTGTETKCYQHPNSLNLGVGGDKIENVLYRIHLGLYSLLSTRWTKLWVVQIGTNNLKPKRGLNSSDIAKYRLLLQSLLRLSTAAGSKILVTGLFKRRDVGANLIDESNRLIEQLVNDMNSSLEGAGMEKKLYYLIPTDKVDERDLVDHVHLNAKGYEKWDESLYEAMEGLLKE